MDLEQPFHPDLSCLLPAMLGTDTILLWGSRSQQTCSGGGIWLDRAAQRVADHPELIERTDSRQRDI
jgi:hypothetical protein